MATRSRSIRCALLVRLLGPLLLLTLIAGAAAYGVARHFSDAVLDRWLYDSAISLANRVHWQDGVAGIGLPAGAQGISERDVIDRVFYEVVSAAGERIAGNASLPAPPQPLHKLGAKQFYTAQVAEDPVRILAVVLGTDGGGPVIVRIAETQQKRTALARQLLWISVVLSLVMATATAAFIWYGIGRGITALEKAVRKTGAPGAGALLTPLALTPDMPSEVFPLVAQINKLIAELSAAHRVNERFIVNAAHQLPTPVATLRVQLESASRERDPQRRAEAVNDAVQVVTHMSRMLHQLLTLAKADESATHPLRDASADVDLIAREEVERRLDDAVALGVDLGYEGAGKPVPVAGNDDLVREALVNLLDNALRYGTSGGQVTVGVTGSSAPELYVEDRGPGIPAAERERVGDRFYRLPGTPGDGCGLGLSIVKEIARLCGASFILDRAAEGSGLRARLVFAKFRTVGTMHEQRSPDPVKV